METGADLYTDLDTMADTENENEADVDWSFSDMLKKGKALAGKAGGSISKGFTAAKNWFTGNKKKPAPKPPPKKKAKAAVKKAANANKAAVAKK